MNLRRFVFCLTMVLTVAWRGLRQIDQKAAQAPVL